MTEPRQIRSFIGVPPDAAFISQLQPLLDDLQTRPWAQKMRWLEPRNWHLTLAFLGNQPADLLQSLHASMQQAVGELTAFSLNSQCISGFPDARSPVIAIEFHQAAELHRLKAALDDALRRHGIVPDPRPLRPHLTLGRWPGDRSASALQPHLQPQSVALSLVVDNIRLYQSLPTTTGPDYQPLWQLDLQP